MHAGKGLVGGTVILALSLMFAGLANAGPIVMNFDQQNGAGEYVDNFYNGGCGSSYAGGSVTCGGPNYGVVWDGALEGYAPNGLWNNTANSSSPPGVMGFLESNNAYMNVAGGFTTGFSFYYTAVNYTGTINVYSGLNGAGTLLATLRLPTTGSRCDGYTQDFSCWDPIGVSFGGIAQSVDFGGTANQIVFDDVTIGSPTPGNVPEPAAIGMFGLGVLLIGLFVGLRRRMQ